MRRPVVTVGLVIQFYLCMKSLLFFPPSDIFTIHFLFWLCHEYHVTHYPLTYAFHLFCPGCFPSSQFSSKPSSFFFASEFCFGDFSVQNALTLTITHYFGIIASIVMNINCITDRYRFYLLIHKLWYVLSVLCWYILNTLYNARKTVFCSVFQESPIPYLYCQHLMYLHYNLLF